MIMPIMFNYHACEVQLTSFPIPARAPATHRPDSRRSGPAAVEPHSPRREHTAPAVTVAVAARAVSTQPAP